MNQLNLFEDDTKRCEICSKPSKGDCCSEECAKIWVEKYINPDNLLPLKVSTETN